jgi:predicted membrane channel-forming protein YqfA (hemolysin III family)
MSYQPSPSREQTWLFFAVAMLALAGALKIVAGIAALVSSGYLTTEMLIPNLGLWGWFFIILGTLNLVAVYLIMSEKKNGRWVGIGLSLLSVIGWFTFMPSFPWWAAIAIVIDIMVVYGLAAHGE